MAFKNISIDFSEANPLVDKYDEPLLVNYDYKHSQHKTWFTPIEKDFRILGVKKVNNPQLYGMYLLCMEELQNDKSVFGHVQKLILYHATSREKANSIVKNNIDWRLTRRSRYGSGACFSPSPDYANTYSGSKGAFIISQVLVKKSQSIGVSYELKVPINKTIDTTINHSGNVFVKYDDFNFYPMYVVSYY